MRVVGRGSFQSFQSVFLKKKDELMFVCVCQIMGTTTWLSSLSFPLNRDNTKRYPQENTQPSNQPSAPPTPKMARAGVSMGQNKYPRRAMASAKASLRDLNMFDGTNLKARPLQREVPLIFRHVFALVVNTKAQAAKAHILQIHQAGQRQKLVSQTELPARNILTLGSTNRVA